MCGQQAVDPDEQPEAAEQDQARGDPPCRRRLVRRTPVAAGIHRRGQVDGTFERALEDRHREPTELADPAAGAAQSGGRAHPSGVGDQLRCEGQRDHRGDPDLVEGGRHVAQQPPGAAERVGRADAAEDRGQLESEVDRVEDRFQGDLAAELDADALGERDLREREEHGEALGLRRQEGLEDDVDRDHDERELEEQRVRAGPGCVVASHRDDEPAHDDDQQQRNRVRRTTGGGRQPERPQPPRPRMQDPRVRDEMLWAHGAGQLLLRRVT